MEQDEKTQNELTSRDISSIRYRDEVDLLRLSKALYKRKYLILGICFLFLLIGLVFAFIRPVKYFYKTTIDIGTTLVNSDRGTITRIIEPPESVLAKFEESYIPEAIYLLTDSSDRNRFKIQANIPKRSNLVVLTSKCSPDMGESCRQLHELATKPLLEDHLRVIDVPRREYKIMSDQAKVELKNIKDPRLYMVKENDLVIKVEVEKMQLISFDDQINHLLSQEKRLEETQSLLRKQILTVEKNLEKTHASWPKAANDVSSESQAMTLLMITNQIERNEERLSELRERLSINLEDQKEILQIEIANKRRMRGLQKDKVSMFQNQLVELRAQREKNQDKQASLISSLENKITELQETRTLGVGVRSLNPAGPHKLVIVFLSGFFGLVCGVLFAFIAEAFSGSQRKRFAENE